MDVGSCFYYCEPRVCVFGPLGYKFAEGRDFSVLTAGSPSQAHSRLSINICRVHISGMLVGKQCANIFVNCQRAHSLTRERDREGKGKSTTQWDHNPFSFISPSCWDIRHARIPNWSIFPSGSIWDSNHIVSHGRSGSFNHQVTELALYYAGNCWVIGKDMTHFCIETHRKYVTTFQMTQSLIHSGYIWWGHRILEEHRFYWGWDKELWGN